MPTSNRSDFHHLLRSASRTARTAVYGPVRTVVWEGRSREAPPYPDQSVSALRRIPHRQTLAAQVRRLTELKGYAARILNGG